MAQLNPVQASGSCPFFRAHPGPQRGDADGGKGTYSPADTGTVRLQLLLPENRHESYETQLVNAEGRTLTTNRISGKSRDMDNRCGFRRAASLMPAGDYRVKLNGVNRTANSERAWRVIPSEFKNPLISDCPKI